VPHAAHRLPSKTVILKSAQFPRCAKCTEPVFFELEYAAPDLFQTNAYRIYELPVIEGEPTPRKNRMPGRLEQLRLLPYIYFAVTDF
jgi:hypothetical protein